MAYQVMTDDDLRRVLSPERAVRAIEAAFRARAAGKMVSPPRFEVESSEGGLVFTAGAELLESHAIGFRVYDSYPKKQSRHEQLVAVFDSRDGVFKGVIIGTLLGALRTAAINALAIQVMANPDPACLGILGSGFQARHHLRAALAVRKFEKALVYSPSAAHREAFAQEMRAETGLAASAAGTAEEVVRGADVLICATRSSQPVFDAGWLKPGVHINTIGPKLRDEHELPLQAAEGSRVIATDSLEQIEALPQPFFLEGTPARERILGLEAIVTGLAAGRFSPGDRTLFCSVGLSGTEVVLANEALKRFEQGNT